MGKHMKLVAVAGALAALVAAGCTRQSAPPSAAARAAANDAAYGPMEAAAGPLPVAQPSDTRSEAQALKDADQDARNAAGTASIDPACAPGAPTEHSAGCAEAADEAYRAAHGPLEPAGQGQAAPSSFTSTAFRKFVIGKSKQQILAAFGRPLSVDDGVEPGSQTYDYSPAETYKSTVAFRINDEATGLEQKFVSVHFDALGMADGVQF